MWWDVLPASLSPWRLEGCGQIKSGAPRYTAAIRAQRHKPAGADPKRIVPARRPATSVNQLDDAMKHCGRSDECLLGKEEKGIHSRGCHRRECLVDLLRTACVGPNQFEPEGARRVVQHLGIVTPSRIER